MKRIISLVISLMMITEISLCYTSTIKINGFGGSVESDEGSTVVITPKVNIEGWNIKSGNVTVTNNQFVMPGSNIEIEGIVEEETYTLTVNPGGATYSGSYNETQEITAPTQSYTITYNYNGSTQANTAATVNRPFSSWSTPTKGSINNLTSSTAVYTYGEGDETVTSNYETGSITLPGAEEREYCTFLGWSENSEAASATYAEGSTFTPTSDITLYAVWEDSRTIITYDANGGSFDNENINKVYYVDTTITETKTSKTSNVSEDGLTHSGAYGDGKPTTYESTDSITIPGVTQLEVTITYQTEDPASLFSYTLYRDWVAIYDSSITPSGSNYGDSISGALAGTTKKTETYIVPGDTVQFYFSSNGSNNEYYGYYAIVTGSYEVTTKVEGEYKKPTKDGYRLLGWSEDSTSSTAEYSANGSDIFDSNINLYAVWQEIVPVAEVAKVGDYVRYNPTGAAVTHTTTNTKTTITPSSYTKSWRVMGVSSGKVVIVPSTVSQNLALEFDDDAYSWATWKTEIPNAFLSDLAASARAPKTSDVSSVVSLCSFTEDAWTSTSWSESSCSYGNQSCSGDMGLYYFTPEGNYYKFKLYGCTGEGTGLNHYMYASFIPIVTLKADASFLSGDGSQASPFVLTIE